MAEFVPSLESLINRYLDAPDRRPLNRRDLARVLGLDASRRRELRSVLRAMELRGEVVCIRGNRWARPQRDQLVTGELSVHRLGFGFVADAADPAREIYIPEEDIHNALHGDRVQVAIYASPQRASRRRGPRPSPTTSKPSWRGRVVRVVERRHADLVGLLKRTSYYAYVIPSDPRFPSNVRIDEFSGSARGAKDDDLVVVHLAPWDARAPFLRGTVVEILGPAGGPGVDMVALLRQRKLSNSFPESAEVEARTPSASSAVRQEAAHRRDLRDGITFTIDPVDAKDYDDAVSLIPRAGGGWTLGVHIADVSHYVSPGSAIDREASARGTTVYLVDRAIFMLPPRLTAEVCSLLPQVDRLCHTALIQLDDEGRVLGAETFPSVIRSRARLTYEQVQATYGGSNAGLPAEILPMLADMRRLAAVLRARRMAAGALNFDLPEVRCELDEAGLVRAIHPQGSLEAYHLIEEFMLLANQAVARRLREARVPTIYRIHDAPDDAQWEQMRMDMHALDVRLESFSREAINATVEAVRGTPLEYSVALAALRNLKRAVYSPACRPHFGLAFLPYTHFTSPIRRYPDLLVHRILKAVEAGHPPPYSAQDLEHLASHCSRREREADDAERESIEIKRIQYYRRLLEEGSTGPFDAVVTGSITRGLLVEIPETQQRGLLPYADYRHRGGSPQVGARVEVELVKVDVARRLVDFRPAGRREASRSTPVRGGARRHMRTRKPRR